MGTSGTPVRDGWPALAARSAALAWADRHGNKRDYRSPSREWVAGLRLLADRSPPLRQRA